MPRDTSGGEPTEGGPRRSRGGRSSRPEPVEAAGRSRGSAIRYATLILAGAAFALSLGAAALALTRPAAADPASCRTTAWDAIPPTDQLPSGWTLTGTSLDADGYNAALVAATSSAASAPPDSIFIKVTCFGPDAHAAFTRSRTITLAGGASEGSLPPVGDESFQAANADGSAIAFIREGSLVASLGSSSHVDPAVLEQVARAVEGAMATAQAGGTPSLGGAMPSPAASEAGRSGSPSSAVGGSESPSIGPSASSTPQHAAPDLEAMLPRQVNGTALETQSTDGTAGLGQDASSQSLIASLKALGKKASDLQIAAAYDPTGALDLNLLAFRAAGVDGATLRQEVLKSWLAGSPSGIHTSNLSLGGKQVVKVDYGDGGTVDYLYAHDGVVVDVASSDPKVAAQVLAALP